MGEPTTTRLMGKINRKKQCDGDHPPEEQLLLDAEKDDERLVRRVNEAEM